MFELELFVVKMITRSLGLFIQLSSLKKLLVCLNPYSMIQLGAARLRVFVRYFFVKSTTQQRMGLETRYWAQITFMDMQISLFVVFDRMDELVLIFFCAARACCVLTFSGALIIHHYKQIQFRIQFCECIFCLHQFQYKFMVIGTLSFPSYVITKLIFIIACTSIVRQREYAHHVLLGLFMGRTNTLKE